MGWGFYTWVSWVCARPPRKPTLRILSPLPVHVAGDSTPSLPPPTLLAGSCWYLVRHECGNSWLFLFRDKHILLQIGENTVKGACGRPALQDSISCGSPFFPPHGWCVHAEATMEALSTPTSAKNCGLQDRRQSYFHPGWSSSGSRHGV